VERNHAGSARAGAPRAPFDSLTSTYNAPFRDQEYLGRVASNVTTISARFSSSAMSKTERRGFVPVTLSDFNVDFTPSYGGGVDITHGTWTHAPESVI